VAGALLSALLGCETKPPISDGPVSISVSDGELVIAVCRDIDIVGISAATRTPGTEWRDFLNAEGDLVALRGDVFSVDEFASSLKATTSFEPSVAPGTELDILILAKNAADNIGGNPEIVEELEEGMWLHGGGTVDAEECGKENAGPRDGTSQVLSLLLAGRSAINSFTDVRDSGTPLVTQFTKSVGGDRR
jgi:hypothetical protein